MLTLNVGSSSLKFAVFAADGSLDAILAGSVDHNGDHSRSLPAVLQKVSTLPEKPNWVGIGHRIVHGGPHFTHPQLITTAAIVELKRLIPFAPEHLPSEISLIEEVIKQFPHVSQVACFDTSFHRDLPRVAKLLPIPRRFEAAGVHRYGFHGLSYEFLCEELVRLGDPAVTQGRVILAHLGSGASLAAVRDGICIDTSMAFTPAGGLVMGTRSGDLDPGLLAYLAQTEGMNAQRLNHLVSHESGLLGVSETSGDVRALLERELNDVRAAEALALFCQQTKKWIGAFAAVLGGLDTLVFAGGIGENNAVIRARICAGLGFLGLELNDAGNEVHAPVISSTGSGVTARVIHTNEERVIASAVRRFLHSAEPPAHRP